MLLAPDGRLVTTVDEDQQEVLIDEPGHGYQVVEEMIKGYLATREDVVAALWQVPEGKKPGLYKAVEKALVDHLAKLKLM